MRTVTFCQGLMMCVGMLIISGCATVEQTRPASVSAGDGELPAVSGSVGASPPTVHPSAPVKTEKKKPVAAITKPEPPVVGSPSTVPAGKTSENAASFDNVEVLDAGLHAKLAILRAGSDRTATNLLSVFVGLKNKTAHPLGIQVQTIYKDKLDNPLNEGKASWVTMHLKPHEETEYRSASLSEDGADFLVRIRSGSNISSGKTP